MARYNDRMSLQAGFRTTLDLFEAGVDLMRQNLRRRFPQADEAEIDRRLDQWLHERPGAESGDCPGRAMHLNDRVG